MSPDLSPRLSLLLRSERYRRLDARPVIRARTHFFAAASIVTRVLAYGGATPFMAALSDALERVNVLRAQRICSGLLYVSGSVEQNTRDFVRYEQGLVQDALDRLRGCDPQVYLEQIRCANGAIARVIGSRTACSSSAAMAVFVGAAESCLAQLGRAIEFSTQSDREALGVQIARSAHEHSPGDDRVP